MSKIGEAIANDAAHKAKMERSKQRGERIMKEMRKKEKEELEDELDVLTMHRSAESFNHGKRGIKRKYDKLGKANKNKK